ncbi:MAG: hypothetical protein GTO02_19455, partial [Candidatus Dadabacteria bacterium]|nr:hypothetical protein [Candidatus Dadabacteria bacterium]NIQ16485.1 hypothetical protein [Candidatus Dadabacteria bacterium]
EEEINQIKIKKGGVVKKQKYEEAARLRDEEIKINDKLQNEKDKWVESLNKDKRVVTPEDVNEVVALMTGIPLKR